MPAQQQLWLETGTERFLARYQADLSGILRGTALVLHDSGQHPSWPATVAALVDELPLHGWTVLAITLPAPAADRSAAIAAPGPAQPPAEPVLEQTSAPTGTGAAEQSSATPSPSPATPEPSTAPEEPAIAAPELLERQAQARIQAALDHLIARNQLPVAMIGFGSGALRAAEFVRSRAAATGAGNPAPVAALGLVAPLERLPGLSNSLQALLPATDLPTLDLVLRNDVIARAEAEARRRAVLHQRDRDYVQLELPPPNHSLRPPHSAVVKRVRGWLQLHLVAAKRNEEKGDQTDGGRLAPRSAAATAPAP